MHIKTKVEDLPLLCIVHIPKTAGSAIRETLISILGSNKVYWIAHKRPLDHWVNCTGGEFDDYTVVGGHDSAATFGKIKRRKIFMSVVRDPVERAISLFNYITCGPDPHHGLRKQLQGLSLVEAIRTSANFRRDVENRQCALIGGQPTFPAALRSICDNEWFIDRHEAVDELFARVCQRFGWPVRGLVFDNVGREGYAEEHLSEEVTIAALKEINQEDSLLVSIFDKHGGLRCLGSHKTNLRAARDPRLTHKTASGQRGTPSGIGTTGLLVKPVSPTTADSDNMTIAVGDAAVVEGVASMTRQISAEEFVGATYKAVLGRTADPSGLETYVKFLKSAPLMQGVEGVVRRLLESREFQTKGVIAEKQPRLSLNPPQTCVFTREQAQWLSAVGTRVDSVLVVRFRPDRGSRPTIHLRDRSLLNVHRVLHSVQYVETLISEYLLHPDYYDMYFAPTISCDRELICIFQTDDQPIDLQSTVGYCAAGSQPALIPDLQFWIHKGYCSKRCEFYKSWIPWEDRASQVFWRGSSTGAQPITLESLLDLPRFRLCAAGGSSTRLHGVLDVKLTDIVQASNAEEARNIRGYVDSLGLLSTHVPQSDFLKYRFQIDIDGNSNSWGFLPKLMMGSCVLKVMSEWRQWYYNGLRPWEHYVPIKNDLSDLEERVAWCLDNDDDAREIGANGMKYANEIVFGTEMLRAAGSALRASRETLGAAS